MTKEDKELLLKDLSARLPYGIKVNNEIQGDFKIYGICENFAFGRNEVCHIDFNIEKIKPYLFPLSSMTDEMLEELNANGFFKYRDTITNVSHLISNNGINKEIYTYIDIECVLFLIEFFNSHHIDYRGLIPMGLAIDATGLNIY